MAKDRPKSILEQKTLDAPGTDDLFAGSVKEDLSLSDLFTTDDDFDFSLLELDRTPTPTAPTTETAQVPPRRHLSVTQTLLILCLIATASLLVYSLLSSRLNRQLAQAVSPQQSSPQTVAPQTTVTPSQPPLQALPIPANVVSAPAQEPLSLKMAEQLYLNRDFDKAYAAFSRLDERLTAPDDRLLRDFVQLRMLLCLENAGRYDEAKRLSSAVAESRSAVLKAYAGYHACLLDIQAGRYLDARAAAYKTIALAGTLSFDWQWALELERDCHFLAAEAITREILSLGDRDEGPADILWKHRLWVDPFKGLSELELRAILATGMDRLSEGIAAPSIRELQKTGAGSNWSVICSGPSIEELLSQIAVRAGVDIFWAGESANRTTIETANMRKRSVSMYMPAATTDQVVTAAAGSVGLLAGFDTVGNMRIFNPAEYATLSDHVQSLIMPAMSLWQQLLLTYYDDVRLPNAHFALAMLHARRDKTTEAIAEYKLVANRFGQTPLAPHALLRSSRLKASVRDYFGARTDLKQLIELYPDSAIVAQAYLELADITATAELFDEAARLYRKVYNLGFSNQSRITGAFGAADCFYKTKDYDSAVHWFKRYIELVQTERRSLTRQDPAQNLPPPQLYTAYFMLGQSCLAVGDTEQACTAFEKTLTGEISREKYVQTVNALVSALASREHYVEALNTIEAMHPWPFTQEESTEILLLKSRVLRSMGLIDQAVTALTDRSQYLTDPQLRARVFFELINCEIAEGKLEESRGKLANLLTLVEPGPLANEIALTLAQVSLQLGRNDQTITVCRQVLGTETSAQTRQQALELLAQAYRNEKNYDKAALALLGKWENMKTD